MENERRAGVFYSPGHDLPGVLRRVREAWPDARIVAVLPDGYAPPSSVPELADEVVITERAHYGARDVQPLLRLIGRIRNARYHIFIVMFDSPKLRMLAALSGAEQRAWVPPRGRPVALPGSAAGVAARSLWRRVKGAAAYAGLWLAVRVPAAKKGSKH